MCAANPKRLPSGLRVLFVFCSPNLGGAERQGLHLALHLKAQGCDVQIWGTQGGDGQVVERCREACLPWSVHRFRWPCRKRSLIRDSWRLLRALRRARPDVILSYTTDPNIGCGLVWRWSSARACIWGQRNVHGLSGHWLERFVFHRASAVICNAAHEVDYLRQTLGPAPGAVHVVHNGVALAPPERSRTQWRAAWKLDESAVAVTMVANFRAVKQHTQLLQAWRELQKTFPETGPRPHLLLAGLPQETYGGMQNLVAKLGLDTQVTFLGQVSDISGLLAASDIGVLISAHEGLPNAVVEYMAAGLPVVATDLPGTREALGDDPTQPFCAPNDVAGLCNRLRELILNPDRRRELGARNRRRAAAEFSLELMHDRTTTIIGDLLHESLAGRKTRA